MSLKPKSF